MFVAAPYESARFWLGEVFEDKRALFESVACDLESPRVGNRLDRTVVVPEHDHDPAWERGTPRLDSFPQGGGEAGRRVEKITEHHDPLGLEPGDARVELREFFAELRGR